MATFHTRKNNFKIFKLERGQHEHDESIHDIDSKNDNDYRKFTIAVNSLGL